MVLSKFRYFMNLFISLIICLGIGYIIPWLAKTERLLISDYPLNHLNHSYLLIGGFSYWILIGFNSLNFYKFRRVIMPWKEPKPIVNPLTRVLSGFNKLAKLGLFLGTIVLAISSPSITNEDFLLKIFRLDLLCIAYVFLYYIVVQSHYIVEEGTLVGLGNKLLFPEEKYRIWPLLPYDLDIANQGYGTFWRKFPLKCKDTKNPVTMNVSMTANLEIEQAPREPLRNLDIKVLTKKTEEWLKKVLQNYIPEVTMANLVAKKIEPQRTSIDGFPVTWQGDIEMETPCDEDEFY